MPFHVLDDLVKLQLLRFLLIVLQVDVLLEDENFILSVLEVIRNRVSTRHTQFQVLALALIVLNFNLCIIELPLNGFLEQKEALVLLGEVANSISESVLLVLHAVEICLCNSDVKVSFLVFSVVRRPRSY